MIQKFGVSKVFMFWKKSLMFTKVYDKKYSKNCNVV